MSSSFNTFKPIAGKLLETALNRALALDPETQRALAALDGRRVSLELESPPVALELRMSGDRLCVGPISDTDQDEADLAIRSTLSGLLSQLPLFGDRRDTLESRPPTGGRVRFSGDAELARHLQNLASRFDPDWQRPFTKLFGDVLGVQIANALRTGMQEMRHSAENLAQEVAEYATEESRDLVGRTELEAFFDDVEVLSDDVDDLDRRVARLLRKTEDLA